MRPVGRMPDTTLRGTLWGAGRPAVASASAIITPGGSRRAQKEVPHPTRTTAPGHRPSTPATNPPFLLPPPPQTSPSSLADQPAVRGNSLQNEFNLFSERVRLVLGTSSACSRNELGLFPERVRLFSERVRLFSERVRL